MSPREGQGGLSALGAKPDRSGFRIRLLGKLHDPSTLAQCLLRCARALHPERGPCKGAPIPKRTLSRGEPCAGKKPHARLGGRGEPRGPSLPLSARSARPRAHSAPYPAVANRCGSSPSSPRWIPFSVSSNAQHRSDGSRQPIHGWMLQCFTHRIATDLPKAGGCLVLMLKNSRGA